MSVTKDQKWMKTCQLAAATFSTCGKRQYYAILLDSQGHTIGSGWNGGPPKSKHCVDGGCPRFLEGSAPGSNYDNCIAIHAEANALLHSDYTARKGGCTLYVNGPPCFGCAKMLVNGGVTRLCFIEDPYYADFDRTVAPFLTASGVTLISVPDQLSNGR